MPHTHRSPRPISGKRNAPSPVERSRKQADATADAWTVGCESDDYLQRVKAEITNGCTEPRKVASRRYPDSAWTTRD